MRLDNTSILATPMCGLSEALRNEGEYLGSPDDVVVGGQCCGNCEVYFTLVLDAQ